MGGYALLPHLYDRLQSIRHAPFDVKAAGALFALKMEVLAAQTPLTAARAFADVLGPSASARGRAFRPLHTYAEEAGAVVGLAHPGGQGSIRMPVVRGEERGADTPVSHRPVAAIMLEDAWVTGRSGLIRVGDILLADYHDEELAAWPVDFRFDPLLFEQPAGMAVAIDGPESGPSLDEAISLVGCTSYNFGHWIVEYMFRLFVMRSQGVPSGIPILIDAGLTQTQRDAVRLYTGGHHPLIEVGALHARFVRRLWVATNLAFVPIMPRTGLPITVNHISPMPSYAAQLCNEMTKSIRPLAGTPRRLFLARSPSLHRRLLNQAEIGEICRSAGFEILYPEEHDFHYQFSLACNADVIIGPEGSAMLLAIHARPGSRVLILNHSFLENLPTFTHLLEERGLKVEILAGECVREDEGYRKFSDYTIAPDDLRLALTEWDLSVPATVFPSSTTSAAPGSR